MRIYYLFNIYLNYEVRKMEIIGATINTSVPGIEEMIVRRDKDRLLRLVAFQLKNGACTVALNAGTLLTTEADDIAWMVKTIQDEFAIPLCLDSPNAEAVEAGLRIHRHGRPMINSTTAEPDRLGDFLPLAQKYNATVVGLLMGEEGVPRDIATRLQCAQRIIEAAREYGVQAEDIYLDPLVFPLSLESNNAKYFLDALRAIRKEFPRCRTICGLNNISYGLPEREILNQLFLTLCAGAGISAVFMEITAITGATVKALRLLMGEDEFCEQFLEAYRQGKLNIYKEEGYHVK